MTPVCSSRPSNEGLRVTQVGLLAQALVGVWPHGKAWGRARAAEGLPLLERQVERTEEAMTTAAAAHALARERRAHS